MRAHVIKNGKVINTIVVDSLADAAGLQLELIDAAIGGTIGDLWDGVKFTTPAPDPILSTNAAAKDAILKLEMPTGFNRGQREYLLAHVLDVKLLADLGAVDAAIAIERAKIQPVPGAVATVQP